MNNHVSYLFKLKHDIRVEAKIDVTKEEIRVLLNADPVEIESIATLFKKAPFSLIDDRTTKIIDRMPYLGRVQAFLVEAPPEAIRRLLERITLSKELFVIFCSKDQTELDARLRELGLDFRFEEGKIGKFQITPSVQCYIQEVEGGYLCIVRGIPFQEIFEDGLEILKIPKVTFAKYADIRKKISVMEKGITEGINELFYHLNNVHDRCPRLGLSKDNIGDYVDWAFSRFRKYALHFIHKHRAKADSRMARMVLNLLGVERGEVILDPFCGSGTFIADAPMMGVKAYGIDINPLSTMIARVKCNLNLPINELREVTLKLLQSKFDVKRSIKSYASQTLNDLDRLANINASLYRKIMEREEHVKKILSIKSEVDEIEDQEIRDFIYTILSRIIIKEFERKNGINVERTFKNDLLQFYLALFVTQRIASHLGVEFKPQATIITADTRKLSLPERVDGILTSPPYFDAVNYLDVTSVYSLALLNLIPDNLEMLIEEIIGSKSSKDTSFTKSVSILPASSKRLIELLLRHGRKNKALMAYKYVADMLECFKRLYAVLNSDRRMIFVVGKYHHWNIDNNTLKVDGASIISDLAEKANFKLEKEILHTIHQISAGTRIKTESILIFKKPAEELEYEEREDIESIFEILRGSPITEVKRFFIEQENS